jgi:Domain amino terminal to FKBP-type peptidyl-prolyl isomerase.
MRKLSILFVVAIAAIFTMSSCQNYKAKNVELTNMNDSLNYTLGLSNGEGIKNYYMQNDTTDAALKEFIGALDKAFKSETAAGNEGEMYQLGLNIGKSIKQQESAGLMNNRTLAFKMNLVRQGLINGLKQFQDSTMTPEYVQNYLQETMRKVQEEQIKAVSLEEDNHEGHQH